MNKKKILDRLQEHWNYAATLYDESRFLGIFLYGSQNYGFATENSDIDSKLIYLPTFDEMCLNKNMLSKELHYEDEHIEIKDIRLFREMFMKQNINFVEILYTEYFILNSQYKDLFCKYFIDNREDIAHFNRGKTLKSVSGQLIHTIKQDPHDSKKLYNAWRLYYFLKDYIANVSYDECIKPRDARAIELLALKRGISPICQSNELMQQSAEEVINFTKELTEQYEDLDSPCYEAALAALNNGVKEILKKSFNMTPQFSKSDFFDNLTAMEHRAYESIVDEIGQEGNISVSKMINKVPISRPVFNNLFNKMKKYNVADIDNMGVKGTFIKITHPELLAEIN